MEQYKTKDFYEASALIASDCKLLKLEPENNFYWFVFESATACRNISDSYWRSELVITAKQYADAIRSLKDRLFANK